MGNPGGKNSSLRDCERFQTDRDQCATHALKYKRGRTPCNTDLLVNGTEIWGQVCRKQGSGRYTLASSYHAEDFMDCLPAIPTHTAEQSQGENKQKSWVQFVNSTVNSTCRVQWCSLRGTQHAVQNLHLFAMLAPATLLWVCTKKTTSMECIYKLLKAGMWAC